MEAMRLCMEVVLPFMGVTLPFMEAILHLKELMLPCVENCLDVRSQHCYVRISAALHKGDTTVYSRGIAICRGNAAFCRGDLPICGDAAIFRGTADMNGGSPPPSCAVCGPISEH
eukprot:719665-Rhodomonas_salina.2